MPPDNNAETLWQAEARWVAAMAARLGSPSFSTGDHAALRRMQPGNPSGRAQIAAERLFALAGLQPDGKDRQRWLFVIHCLALAGGRHDKDATAGRVLSEIRYSEERLTRLLSTDFEVVADVIPRLARLIGSKGVPVDWLPLGQLLRWTGRDETRANYARHRIARTYARAAASQ